MNLQSSNKESRKVDASSKQNQEERHRAALKSVKCGELSRAARILTSDGLIPPSPETEEKLKAKHPSQSEELRLSTVNTPQIDLKRSVFLEALRRAPRGSGAGPSGWRYEHLRLLLENILTCDLLFGACCHIAKSLLQHQD